MHIYRYHLLTGRYATCHVAPDHILRSAECRLHGHDFFEIMLVLGGNCLQRLGEHRQTLQSGSLCFIRNTDKHIIECAPASTVRLANVALAPDWWRRFEMTIGKESIGQLVSGMSPLVCSLNRLDLDRVMNLVRQLISRRGDGLVLVQFVSQCLGLLAGGVSSTPSPEWLEQALQRLRLDSDLSEGVYRLQRYAGKSPEHLARICRKRYGATPSELVNRIRVERIQQRLMESDQKIVTLAMEEGFSHLSYFNRTFRRLTGVTPHEWRKQQRAPLAPV